MFKDIELSKDLVIAFKQVFFKKCNKFYLFLIMLWTLLSLNKSLWCLFSFWAFSMRAKVFIFNQQFSIWSTVGLIVSWNTVQEILILVSTSWLWVIGLLTSTWKSIYRRIWLSMENFLSRFFSLVTSVIIFAHVIFALSTFFSFTFPSTAVESYNGSTV